MEPREFIIPVNLLYLPVCFEMSELLSSKPLTATFEQQWLRRLAGCGAVCETSPLKSNTVAKGVRTTAVSQSHGAKRREALRLRPKKELQRGEDNGSRWNDILAPREMILWWRCCYVNASTIPLSEQQLFCVFSQLFYFCWLSLNHSTGVFITFEEFRKPISTVCFSNEEWNINDCKDFWSNVWLSVCKQPVKDKSVGTGSLSSRK